MVVFFPKIRVSRQNTWWAFGFSTRLRLWLLVGALFNSKPTVIRGNGFHPRLLLFPLNTPTKVNGMAFSCYCVLQPMYNYPNSFQYINKFSNCGLSQILNEIVSICMEFPLYAFPLSHISICYVRLWWFKKLSSYQMLGTHIFLNFSFAH